MTLHFYFARKFLVFFVALSATFMALLLLFDLVEHVRWFDLEEIGFWALLQLLLMNVPKEMYQIIPLIMILSSLTLFLNLARSSELVVARASGRSALVSLLAPVGAAFLIGLLSVSTLNPIVASTTKKYDELAAKYKGAGNSVLSIQGDGIWLRQGGSGVQTVIFARTTNRDATVLGDVTFLTYADNGSPVERISAEFATLTDNTWQLSTAKIWPLSPGRNSESFALESEMWEIETTLTREQIRDSFGKPRAVSVWDLPIWIEQLGAAGFSTRRHEMWLHMELAQPIFLIAMVLVSAAFTMRHTRFGRTGVASLAATMIGFGLYYIRNFAQILGENGQIPIELAAWAPPIASVLFALGLILQMEDG